MGRVDHEGEIGVVIGRRASRVDRLSALDHVAALVPANDVTARDLQRADSQWSRAKGFDTFLPLGAPIPVDGFDPDGLEVVCRVNGEERQRGRSADLAFGIPFLIEYISHVMTLEPGDLILTGTPEGVGPLSPGDEVEVELIGYGGVTNPVRTRDA